MMGPLFHRRFLGCRDCGTLVPADAHERNRLNGCGDEMAAAIEEFVAAHRPHRLVDLRRTETDSLVDRPFWDPMATVHIELSDGEKTYVAKACRRSVEEPREYVFASGSVCTLAAAVDVDERDVRRGLDLEFFPHAIRPTKIDDFLNALHTALRGIDADELEIAFVDAEDPQVSIARMPEQTFQQLLAASRQIFDAWEVPLVQRFLRDNRDEDGVLALRVRRQLASLSD